MQVLDDKQQQVVAAIKAGKNVLVDGPPGSGKTALIRAVCSLFQPEHVALTAMTGVAANNLDGYGVTLHSWSGLGSGDLEPNLEKIRRWRGAKYATTQLLVIDEVSMLDDLLFTRLNRACKLIRSNNRFMGGLQVLFVGDVGQIPPVKGDYFFQSGDFQYSDFRCFELDAVHRQKDAQLIDIFKRIRVGTVTDEDVDYIHSISRQDDLRTSKTLTLCSRKIDAQNYNDGHMDDLKTRCFSFTATDKQPEKSKFGKFFFGRFNYEQVFGLADQVNIKRGMRMMLTKNCEYGFNGQFGTVGRVMRYEGKSKRDVIEVFFDGDDPTKPTMVEQIKLSDPEGYSRTQFPIKQAWAYTLHKSQCLTLDQHAVVDFSGVFCHGQALVGLSRFKDLGKVRLIGLRKEHFLIMDGHSAAALGHIHRCITEEEQYNQHLSAQRGLKRSVPSSKPSTAIRRKLVLPKSTDFFTDSDEEYA